MKFGGLSESEVEEISKILSQDVIPFEVTQSEAIQSCNTQSIKNDLRHFSPPNILTHCLAITIEDADFQKLSMPCRALLLTFGITDQAPAPEDFMPDAGTTIHQKLAKDGNGKAAMNLKHQLIILIIAGVLIWLLKVKFL